MNWQRIEEIFGVVTELEPAARSAHLDRLCGSDSELRRELESLLASHEAASTAFLDRPVAEVGGPALPNPPASGERVGAYRLLDVLGEGGMGKVYLAERADGAFDRRVAVKVLRQGMESDTAVLRFDLERRILAGLDHPGIARLLGGGTTDAGAPYVVMEWVDGESIDLHCDSHRLSAEQRVDLYLEVVEAVASAHRSLVIHRDIKPSNVLVNSQGRAKLLDFGIAKMLDRPPDGRPDDALGSMTQSWHRVLTPNYASPEQLRGEQVTVATDVYLLGILLYKLLSGRLPHRLKDRSLAEVERILTAERPQPPSQALLEPEREDGEPLPEGVHGIDTDLDHIVLKALRNEPAERYDSVQQLADDLRRFREGKPIEARSGNRRYALKKFARRHWRSLASVGLVFVFLAVFAADRAIQVERREQALAQAEAALQRSQGIRSFVEDLFWQADPAAAKGRKLTVAEAVRRGEKKLAQGRGGPPEVDAILHGLFGRIRFDLGEYDAAVESLETSRQIFASIPDKDATLRAAEWQSWGDLGLARLYQLGMLTDEGAEEVIAASIAIARLAYDKAQSVSATDPRLALSISNPLAHIYCVTEQWQRAEDLTREMMGWVERLEGDLSIPVAEALGRRALILKTLEEDWDGARELYSRALEIYLELEGPVHPQVANLHNQLGLVTSALGDTASALTFHREALRVRRLLFPEGHWDVRKSHLHLANLLRAEGDLQQAIRHLEQAVALSTKIYEEFSGWTVSDTLRLARVLVEDGQLARAEALLLTQLSPESRKARKEGSGLIMQAEGILGVVRLAQGKDGGEQLLVRSLEDLRRTGGYEDAITWLEDAAASLED